MLVAQTPFQGVVVVFVGAFVVEVEHTRVERVTRMLDVRSNSLISNYIAIFFASMAVSTAIGFLFSHLACELHKQ